MCRLNVCFTGLCILFGFNFFVVLIFICIGLSYGIRYCFSCYQICTVQFCVRFSFPCFRSPGWVVLKNYGLYLIFLLILLFLIYWYKCTVIECLSNVTVLEDKSSILLFALLFPESISCIYCTLWYLPFLYICHMFEFKKLLQIHCTCLQKTFQPRSLYLEKQQYLIAS